MAVRESAWNDEQQAWMVALAEYRASCCQRCGGDLHETTDPANENAYQPRLPIRCHRCTGLIRSEEAYVQADQRQALMHIVDRPRRG